MPVSWCHISFQRQSYLVISFTCPSKSTRMLSSGPFKTRTPPEELLSKMIVKTSLRELGSSLLPCWEIWRLGIKKHQRKGRFLWEPGRPGRLKKHIHGLPYPLVPSGHTPTDTLTSEHHQCLGGNSKSSRFKRKINFQTSFPFNKTPPRRKIQASDCLLR